MIRRSALLAIVAAAALAAASAVGLSQERSAEKAAAALVVRALAPDDTPLVGAEVEARVLPAPRRETWGRLLEELALAGDATTDAKGEARFDLTGPATWRVAVRAAGRATSWRAVRVDPARPSALTVRLAEGCALDGVVEGGEGPVARAVVVAGPVGFEADWARVLATATSDATSRFRLDGLPRGGIDVWAGRNATALRWCARVAVPGVPTVELDLGRGGERSQIPGPGRAPLESDAEPAAAGRARVRVRVLTVGGDPVPGATVTLGELPRAEHAGFEVWPPPARPIDDVTGPSGEVEFTGLDADDGLPVTVSAPGFALATATAVASEKEAARIDVVLSAARDVVVRVVDAADDGPVAGAWLWLGPDVEPEAPMISAVPIAQQRSELFVGRTGADGTCRLVDLGTDAVRVHARAGGRHDAEARIAPDAKVATVVLGAHLRLSGAIRWDEDGRPATGVGFWVFWVEHPEGWTCNFGPFAVGIDGRFDVGGLRPGTYQVAIERSGEVDVAPQLAGPFAAGKQGVAIRVRPGRRVRGRVVDEAGRPVAGARVHTFCRPDGFLSSDKVASDADGAFTVRRSAHGPISVGVELWEFGEGGREGRFVEVGPVDPAEYEPVRVVVAEGLSIEGRVTYAGGRPLPNVKVVAVPAGESLWSERCNSCRTAADGTFRIGGLAPGTYRLWDGSDPGGFEGERKPLDPDPGTAAGTKGVALVWR